MITVSATNKQDEWPTWSNWGTQSPQGWPGNASAPVAIAAPGASILSTAKGGGTTTMNGTSMASPHVAGVAAVLLQVSDCPADYSAFSNIRAAILNDAEDSFDDSSSGKSHKEGFVNVSTSDACPQLTE